MMKILWGTFFWLCPIKLFLSGVQCSPNSSDEGGSQSMLVSVVEALESPPTSWLPSDVENGHRPLSPFFKVLSYHNRQGLEDGTQRPHPDARALRYMKRLYKMFATKDGVPKTSQNHLYNTVRLYSPLAECKHLSDGEAKGDLHSVDLLFNLDCVTNVEHLLKSVLLYSFDKSFSKSLALTCTCSLTVQEHVASNQLCPNISHAMTFNLHLELRRKWVEIDVTSFLQPLIASNKRNIHMAVNVTCMKNDQAPNFNLDSFSTALVAPSLLLYLNDTSDQAYHRNNLLKLRRKKPLRSGRKKGPFIDSNKKTPGKALKQGKRALRLRRDEDGKKENAPVSIHDLRQYFEQFLFSQNECELHNFWLRFSQLKWDRWIIAPERYNPHYCKGKCPRVAGHRYGSPVHTMVQNIIYEKLDTSVPRPSCVPAEYSPLSVLKVEPDRSVVYKEYEDMIATKCTCR